MLDGTTSTKQCRGINPNHPFQAISIIPTRQTHLLFLSGESSRHIIRVFSLSGVRSHCLPHYNVEIFKVRVVDLQAAVHWQGQTLIDVGDLHHQGIRRIRNGPLSRAGLEAHVV
jgi:hypothetical protein